MTERMRLRPQSQLGWVMLEWLGGLAIPTAARDAVRRLLGAKATIETPEAWAQRMASASVAAGESEYDPP